VFIEAKDDEGGGDNWSYKLCKAPVISSPPTNQLPVFLQAGCPSCRPTNSVKALNGKKISHPMDLLTPSSRGVFRLCLWPLTVPGYLGGGLPCLSSALWCQYPQNSKTSELCFYNGVPVLCRRKRNGCCLLFIVDNSNVVSTDTLECRHQLQHRITAQLSR